jgi:hypothetical protein
VGSKAKRLVVSVMAMATEQSNTGGGGGAGVGAMQLKVAHGTRLLGDILGVSVMGGIELLLEGGMFQRIGGRRVAT